MSEVDALKTGRMLTGTTLLVQLIVEFVPVYFNIESQPLSGRDSFSTIVGGCGWARLALTNLRPNVTN